MTTQPKLIRTDCPPLKPFATVPEGEVAQASEAAGLLNYFSKFTTYRHGEYNPYRKWLTTEPEITVQQFVDFLATWFWISRRQPQILFGLMSANPEWSVRKQIFVNVEEEDGHYAANHVPHYELLLDFVNKLGGRFVPDADTKALVDDYHRSIRGMQPWEAVAALAVIEHPALDISSYFQTLTRLVGRPELVRDDLYLKIHVAVEPIHIILSHGNALDWATSTKLQLEYGFCGQSITDSFSQGMQFWEEFWPRAFAKLGYPQVPAMTE